MKTFEIGDLARVITVSSDYLFLTGKIISIEKFGDSSMVEFSSEELARANRPERVKSSTRVHFYWRELQEVNEYAGN